MNNENYITLKINLEEFLAKKKKKYIICPNCWQSNKLEILGTTTYGCHRCGIMFEFQEFRPEL